MSCSRGCCPSQAAHYRGIALSGPSSKRQAERQESSDMDAYKRLRASGVQPKQIAGAAELEKFASTHHEVEHANIITDAGLRRRVTRAWDEAPAPTLTPSNGDAA